MSTVVLSSVLVAAAGSKSGRRDRASATTFINPVLYSTAALYSAKHDSHLAIIFKRCGPLKRCESCGCQWILKRAHNAVVARPLCKRKAPGSIPGVSNALLRSPHPLRLLVHEHADKPIRAVSLSQYLWSRDHHVMIWLHIAYHTTSGHQNTGKPTRRQRSTDLLTSLAGSVSEQSLDILTSK